jgi:hypothetical protein
MRERCRPGVTMALLHHDYLQKHEGGLQYTAFCGRYWTWRKSQDVTMRQPDPDQPYVSDERYAILRRLSQEAGEACMHLQPDRLGMTGASVRQRLPLIERKDKRSRKVRG